MLFNSFEFIFGFLPVTLIGFYLISSKKKLIKQQLPLVWLTVTSLFFYGWSNPQNLAIILVSLFCNYGFGYLLSKQNSDQIKIKIILFLGVTFNLLLIAYFKYANFFLENFNQVTGTDYNFAKIILPLGISFFTFQQIAYLVDTYQGKTKEHNLLNYALFVSFFPELISGPIVHHKELIPQFEESKTYRFNSETLAIGLTVFVAGLFKKVIFADSIAQYANLAFNAASGGINLTFSESWVGALAYTLQLYFDFSGYSDMAIGLAYMFGIRLPLNFNSPYKAISISDFWRRWHITLSNFLRDYLYIPLGGNRQGFLRQYGNLLVTMLLGGLWHGAAWTYVFWGGLHGLYLVINHAYRTTRKAIGQDLKQDGWLLRGIGWLVTFLAVVVSWVFFRADSFATATSILRSMIGLNGIQLPIFLESQLGFLRNFGVGFLGFTMDVGISQKYATFGVVVMLLIVWFTPNTQQWMGVYNPTLTQPKESDRPSRLQQFWQNLSWKPSNIWTIIMAGITAVSLLCFTRVSEFLYFKF